MTRRATSSPDVIVVGLGAMGSASAMALAREGLSVLGVDRFAPPHVLGSSHGRTRIIREAYFEHPSYVPLVRRAYEGWRELELAAERSIIRKTRGLMIGSPGSTVVAGAVASARAHDIPHAVLSAESVRRHFPMVEPGEDMIGVLEERAGVLFPEACIAACLELAGRHGAEIRLDEPVVAWEARAGSVRVRTSRGEHRAGRLVLAAGAWTSQLVPELRGVLRVERQLTHWFEPVADPDAFGPGRCPITLWEYAPGRMFYTLPDFGDGLKAAVHHEGEVVPDPLRADHEPRTAEAAAVAELLRRYMPRAAGRRRRSEVCLYTNTPDQHFIIDRHPRHPHEVVVLSPCSGHGFKFATAVGEIAADLVTAGRSRLDISMFAMARLTATADA